MLIQNKLYDVEILNYFEWGKIYRPQRTEYLGQGRNNTGLRRISRNFVPRYYHRIRTLNSLSFTLDIYFISLWII